MNEDEEPLSETENFVIWRSREENGDLYHVELGGVSLHMSDDEFEEFVVLVKGVS